MKKMSFKSLLKGAVLLSMIMSVGSLTMISCGDDEEGRIDVDNSAPEQVRDVQSSELPGGVTLSWIIPSSPSFMYSKVEYTTSKGEQKYILISKEKADANGRCSTTIEGFASTDAVSFDIYACSVKGNNQGAVKFSANPGAPAFLEVVNTVQVAADKGGVLVSWKNDFAVKVYLAISYKSTTDASKSGSTTIEVPANSTDGKFVPLAYGNGEFLSGEECSISVVGQDVEANSSDAKEFKATPEKVTKLSRDGWSVPGYDETANEPTIGYSSHEAKGEGAAPNGRVMAILDGKPNTFWHASWKVVYKYPHWFIIDMGKDVTVYSVELTRRIGNAKGQRGQIIYTCSDFAASDKGNPESWGWENHGAFAFDAATDLPQVSRLKSNPVARYIKVYFGTEHRGDGDYAMLSEMNVYGEE